MSIYTRTYISLYITIILLYDIVYVCVHPILSHMYLIIYLILHLNISCLIYLRSNSHEVKDALWHRIDDLRVVFRHYAGMVSDAMNNMSTITLAQVLRACGVTDRQLSEARWEKIFNRQGLSDDLEEVRGYTCCVIT